ncbi:MAG TPA: glutamate synthase central domain-containing protein, partial [Streptosporangiaceae bacterium]
MTFLPVGESAAAQAKATVERIAAAEGLAVLGWRDVPHDRSFCGRGSLAVLPGLAQLFVANPTATEGGLTLDRRAFCLRKRAEHQAGIYFASLSARTIVYKGMLTALQLDPFFPDLSDPAYTSALAMVHSRFSTNTFPSWPLAHPYRFIAHNGEINTVRGNRNWMRAREAMLATGLIPPAADGSGMERLLPILDNEASDSASFDECLELLHLGGRSLPHAILMMIPEPWENHEAMDPARRAFYRFHAAVMEPWDGPACVAFTDGTLIGAVLDRNGLRPSRYWVTHDGLVILASEVGVLDIDPANVARKGRLQPGRIFLADTASRRILEDGDVKAALAAEHPYQDWLHAGLLHLDDLPDRERELPGGDELTTLQLLAGYTEEELRVLLAPMARAGAEPVGSMGTDTPIAVLSGRPRLIFDYFTQLFAQVTNPPLDAIREELVTSLATSTGPEENLLAPGPASCRQIVLPYPVISDNDLTKIIHINDDGNLPGFAAHVVDGRFPAAGGGAALRERLADIRAEVSAAIGAGARIIILSDRGASGRAGPSQGWDPSLAPIPSLLLTGAVHHHLIRERTRTRAGLVVECGDARESHHIALLIGYGAAAVNPYLALESV